MTEEEKKDAQVLELSYDFSCRIIRLYKYLNEGKLSMSDRDIINALGRLLFRSATSINANMNETQHPQSDSDFLSKSLYRFEGITGIGNVVVLVEGQRIFGTTGCGITDE